MVRKNVFRIFHFHKCPLCNDTETKFISNSTKANFLQSHHSYCVFITILAFTNNKAFENAQKIILFLKLLMEGI